MNQTQNISSTLSPQNDSFETSTIDLDNQTQTTLKIETQNISFTTGPQNESSESTNIIYFDNRTQTNYELCNCPELPKGWRNWWEFDLGEGADIFIATIGSFLLGVLLGIVIQTCKNHIAHKRHLRRIMTRAVGPSESDLVQRNASQNTPDRQSSNSQSNSKDSKRIETTLSMNSLDSSPGIRAVTSKQSQSTTNSWYPRATT